MIRLRLAALAVALLLTLTACGSSGAAEPTAAPTALPTIAPTPTPEPTAVPAPSGNPLTGLEEEGFAGQRPIAITFRTLDGSAPLWGIADADVLIAGVTEGRQAALMGLYASADRVVKAGPVGPGRDLLLQMALPLNAVPVHIDKNIYASNLLNVLAYQDLDGYHIGRAAFSFDTERSAAGYREENCWYTTAELLRGGMGAYGAAVEGETQPLFDFTGQPAPGAQNAASLTLQFSVYDIQRFAYDEAGGCYLYNNADGSPVTDGNSGAQPSFANVLVLYASSGVKDDGYTRQYDLSGGDGIYLTGGGWQVIRWQKGDATAPLALTGADGAPLKMTPGKTFIAIWGGYYGQDLTVQAADGSAQTLPERPALLASGVSDEAAANAEREYLLANAQAAFAAAQVREEEAVELVRAAAATEDTEDDAVALDALEKAKKEIAETQSVLEALQAGTDGSAPAGEPNGEAAGASVEPPANTPEEAPAGEAGEAAPQS